MPRSKTPHRQPGRSKSALRRMENTTAGGKPGYRLSFGRLLSRWLGRKGLIEPRRELHVAWDDLKRRMRGHRSSCGDRHAGLRGVGRAAGAIGSRMHARSGRAQGQAANPVKRCFGFISGNAEPGVGGSRRPDPDHAATAHPGCGRRHRRQEGHRFSGTAMPGETGCRSVFRLSVHLPQPPGDSDKTVGL